MPDGNNEIMILRIQLYANGFPRIQPNEGLGLILVIF